jgi:RNA polymerase sigma-70 factor (ECF subfamily)
MKVSKDISKEFLEIYDQLADPLFRHCLYKVSNREKALDLVQESFSRTWEYLAGGKKVKSLKSFIYRVANNLIIDEYRKKKTDSLDALFEEGFDPHDESIPHVSLSAEARIAVEGLKNLPEQYREIMELRYVADLSIGEIADVLRESENNVSVRLTRGMQKLRELLHAHTP